uniref:Uncharacterized protein n=1 Tax=Glossina austeni TaxID=7395 RepID=A0A1A9VDH9_GLOAU
MEYMKLLNNSFTNLEVFNFAKYHSLRVSRMMRNMASNVRTSGRRLSTIFNVKELETPPNVTGLNNALPLKDLPNKLSTEMISMDANRISRSDDKLSDTRLAMKKNSNVTIVANSCPQFRLKSNSSKNANLNKSNANQIKKL